MNAATIKEELEKRAAALEARLATVIERVRSTHPIEARILLVEERELKLLAGELALARFPLIVAALERRLNELEIRVAAQLQRIEGHSTGSTPPPTGTRPQPPTGTSPQPSTETAPPQTVTPTARPTAAPTAGPTAAPTAGPTGAPTGRPTGTPPPRPTTTA